jgi:phosphatidate cytidylyltransferase
VAAVFVPVVAFLIWRGGIPFLCLTSTIIGLALIELYQGLRNTGRKLLVGEGVILGILVPVSLYLRGAEILPLVLVVTVLFISLREFFKFRVEASSASIFLTLGGILYISFLFSYVIPLRAIPEFGMGAVFTLFFVTWMGDSGAYFIGTVGGKHKLFPRISPRKSIEGLVGGILVSCLAIFVSQFWLSFPFLHSVILGVLIGVMGQLGDFFESMLKREMKRKDFGLILPGHGGVLDRFDSLLFTTPVFYYYLKYFVVKI